MSLLRELYSTVNIVSITSLGNVVDNLLNAVASFGIHGPIVDFKECIKEHTLSIVHVNVSMSMSMGFFHKLNTNGEVFAGECPLGIIGKSFLIDASSSRQLDALLALFSIVNPCKFIDEDENGFGNDIHGGISDLMLVEGRLVETTWNVARCCQGSTTRVAQTGPASISSTAKRQVTPKGWPTQ